MEKIAVLDCGGQYTKVIDRKIREAFVKSDIFPAWVKAADLAGYSGIILTGSPESIKGAGSPRPDSEIFSLGIPVLGICYGMHLIAEHFGGKVTEAKKKEYGEAEIKTDNTCPLFDGLSNVETVLLSIDDEVSLLPEGFKTSADFNGSIAAFYNAEKKIYGVQFFPEVDMTVNGRLIFENFLRKICGVTENYALEDRLDSAIELVRKQVGGGKVMVFVSGGVDSAVSTGILLRALPAENIYAVHVDHGFMRKNESDTICDNLTRNGLKNLIRLNAKDIFYKNLEGVTDPEKKRNIIGETFIAVLKEEMNKLNLDPEKTFIAQGTLRPDLIESGNPEVSAHSKKIKTHHNDVDIVRRAREKGLIVETNYDWHKDEVRRIAVMIGLSPEIANRQPFPGPGLAVRLLLQDGKKTVDSAENEALKKLVSEGEGAGKFSAVMLPVNSVGVYGDNRTYAWPAAIYAKGGEAPDWAGINAVTRKITNNLKFINRVVYVVGSCDGIENVKAYPMYVGNGECADLLREIDYIVTKRFENKKLSQTFAVLLPIGSAKRYSVVIRTFISTDFMTGRPAQLGGEISFEELSELAEDIKRGFPEIEFVFYDVTGKPPATTEWE
ncbi:MAG: glutamine-hydrolyzing GMP synthase [Clostridiales bacterium]|jgi:GMP synthase (glutamine-hydrolysing)|nr:glutamine-hydrolyzing GMP synthase [Clostridiales bacterium]